MKSLLLYSIIGSAAIAVALLVGTAISQSNVQASSNGDEFFIPGEDHAHQVDLGLGPFFPSGKAGSFKLLGDFTPGLSSGHIAASNINCDKNGLSPLKILLANAVNGSGATKGELITLNGSNMINDVSWPGFFCTYHIEFFGLGTDQLHNVSSLFVVTDIALVNTIKGANVQPHPTASATLHVTDCPEHFANGSQDSLQPNELCQLNHSIALAPIDRFSVEDHAYQVDLGLGPFFPSGKPGSFKLLGDFSPGGIDSAHVAVSNVNCNKAGTSPLAVLFANAQVNASTPVNIVRLNSTNMITDVSVKGQFCTYHVETPGIVANQNPNVPFTHFRITDIAIVNTNPGSNVQPHPTASATLHVTDCGAGTDNFSVTNSQPVTPFILCGDVYPIPPTVTINDVKKLEGDSGTTDFNFTVTRSGLNLGFQSTVDFATLDGTANATDYDTASGTVTFAPGNTSKTITVKVNGDTDVEGDETFNVDLSNCVGCTISDNLGVGTIENDDTPPPTITITDVNKLEGVPTDGTIGPAAVDTTDFEFTVSRIGDTSGESKVNYTTSDGTANAPFDYQAISLTTLTFAPGETFKTITVKVNGDTDVEGDETFNVDLSNCVGCTISDNLGVGTIENDDFPAE